MLDNGRSVNLERETRRGRRPGGDAVIIARLADTQPLEWADGHWLAGFVEAEGCFSLVQSHDRRSWRCVFALVQRDDDAALLAGLQRLTGLGSLSPIKAAGGSAPQVCWTVSSRLECTRLAEILTTYPLRGRKALEFSIWSAALRTWSEASSCRPLSRRLAVRLARAAEQLRSLRRYVDPPRHVALWARSEPGLIPYLGGFFTGEGSFGLDQKSARITVNLRRDDLPLLEVLISETRIGRIYKTAASGTSHPAARWIVVRQDEIQHVIAILDQAGLRGRKQREFAAWRTGAQEFVRARMQARRRNQIVVEHSAVTLRATRRYRAPKPDSVPLGAPAPTQRQVIIDILRSWASNHVGPLSCEAYTLARGVHRSWPSRNTVAAAFGLWSDALDAAGLGHRAAATRETVERRARASRAANRQRNDDRRAAQREAVLSAVRDLAAALGQPPRLQEFAEWRAQERPELPSVATVYRLFPSGWDSVVAAAGLSA